MDTVERPEALGIAPSGLLAFLDALANKGLELHGLVLLRHGKVAWRMDFAPYDTRSPHLLFSLSKSFTSAAAGFAVSEGYIKYEDPVISFFPDKVPADLSPLWRRVTVHDLLCMGSGLSEDSDVREGEDWVRGMLRKPVVHEPGTRFHYNSMSTYLVSAILQQVTKQTVRDYLMPRLFAPLGIEAPEWDACPMGISCGGWGLHLSTQDIALFGQLLLKDGVWEGRQLLPAGWVERATRKQIDNAHHSTSIEWRQGYGHQFWRCSNGHYRGEGMHGQVCWVMPELDAVLAVTAGLDDRAAEYDCVRDILIPSIGVAAIDDIAFSALKARMDCFAYPIPRGALPDDLPVDGQYADAEDNRLILLRTAEGLHIDFKHQTHISCTCGIGAYHTGSIDVDVVQPLHFRILAACGWDAEAGALDLVLRLPNAPFTFYARLSIDAEGLTMTAHGVGFPHRTVLYRRM